MAQTLLTRRMRAVKTITGAPPIAQRFQAGEALVAGDVVVLVNSTNKLAKCDGTILQTAGTDDHIDVSDLTAAGEGLLAGVCLGAAAANDNVVVALAHPNNIFEANFGATVDGTTAVANVLDVTDLGLVVGVVLMDTGEFVISSDVSNNNSMGYIVEAGYGFDGESTQAGHGVIGDTNVRARFIFSDSIIRTGSGRLYFCQ